MQQYELLEIIQQEMQKSAWDIKAEPQLLQCMERGLLQEDFMISADQLFKREYSRDIVGVENKDQGNREMLLLHLSRSGLYDHLPEGLFFQQPQQGKRLITVADMTTDYKYNKKKEEEVRLFFLPFENDFFLQRIRLEEEENRLLQGLQSGLLTDYFNRFWNLPEDIPQSFAGQLILLLPYVSKIAGNFNLTAQCLKTLLNEEVNIIQKTSGVADAQMFAPSPALGQSGLGLDMICGDSFWEGDPLIDIAIGPLTHSHIEDYLDGGERHTLMETFNRFFIPAGMDVTITIQLPVEMKSMILSKDSEPILGYSSVLG
ncbi:MAG: type VI secretion system baseplate subunit TssG [Agriterribacter sp.]